MTNQLVSIAPDDLARITGGQLAGCPIFTNGSGAVTVRQNGQQTLLDDVSNRATVVSPGAFDVTGVSGTVSGTCTPGSAFGLVGNPFKAGDFGVMPMTLQTER